MEPIVDELRGKYSDKIEFQLIDLTKPAGGKVGDKYRVYLTPTFVITTAEGKEVDRLIGEVPKKTLQTFIDKNLGEQKQ